MKIHPTRMVLILGLALSWVSGAAAQGYPSKPVRFLVGFPAGGGSDLMARVVATGLEKELGQTVLVENRSGAGGQVAATALAGAPADGYMALLGDRGMISVNPELHKNAGFDPRKDFIPVRSIAAVTMVLAAGPSMKATSLREFISEVKANPGKVNYASPGAGSVLALTYEIFKQEAGLDIPAILYRGGSQPYVDIMQGRVASIVSAFQPGMRAFVGDGKLRIMAVARDKRLPEIPDVPTFTELGYRNLETPAWAGMFVRAGTQAEIVERLGDALSKTLQLAEIRTKLTSMGWPPLAGTQAELRSLIAEDLKVLPGTIERLGIKAE